MEFGTVANSELNNIDFSLPPDGEYTRTILQNGKKVESPDLRIGLAKWGRKEWVGKLYPDRSKEADFLHHYTKNFNTIELNAVFYSIPKAELISKWKRMIDAAHEHDFLFLPKMSRVISHMKRLKNVDEETSLFISNLSLFGKHLGPILLQLGDNFPPRSLPDLDDFFKSLPNDYKFVIEVRHEEWFREPGYRKAAFNLFRAHQIGTVITDAHGRRDCSHMELTIPEAYIRFNGTDDQNRTIDYLRIDDWSKRIKTWVDNGLQKLYFIISQRDDSTTPELVQYAIQRFNQVLGTSIPEIAWKADAPVTSVPMMSVDEWAASEIAQIKIDIEIGGGKVTD